MMIVMDIIYFFLSIGYLPYLFLKKKWHAGYSFRLGKIPEDLANNLKSSRNIWIHAVSVGEVLAITDLIERLWKAYPNDQIVCSTVTKTGYELAKGQLRGKALVIYAPLDFSWVVKKFVSLMKPRIYIAAETELWPNLYLTLNRHGVPIIQVNGRLSEQSYKGYRRLSVLTKKVLACVNLFCMQSQEDAQRIMALGADHERVEVVGNLKFDNLEQVGFSRLSDFGFQPTDALLIAGSTHPGEEEIILSIFKKLSVEFADLRLVIAPRHIERTEEIIRLVTSNELTAQKLSECFDQPKTAESVVVVDTIGQLRTLYSLATVVFVGKSLKGGGGQNMIEPASFGKATLVGPLTHNFKDIVAIFLKNDALLEVNNEEELLNEIRVLLTDTEKRVSLGQAAKSVVDRYRGATTKTAEKISAMLETVKSS